MSEQPRCGKCGKPMTPADSKIHPTERLIDVEQALDELEGERLLAVLIKDDCVLVGDNWEPMAKVRAREILSRCKAGPQSKPLDEQERQELEKFRERQKTHHEFAHEFEVFKAQGERIDELESALTAARSEAEEAKRERDKLRETLDDIGCQVANEKAGNLEHLIASALIGKHTTLIGKSRYKQLTAAEAECERLKAELAKATERN